MTSQRSGNRQVGRHQFGMPGVMPCSRILLPRRSSSVTRRQEAEVSGTAQSQMHF